MMTKMGTLLLYLWVMVFLLTQNEASKSYNLTVGPKKNESGRFVYKGSYGLSYCYICEMKALMSSTFKNLQQPLCYQNYKNYSNIPNEITQYERDNHLYALCESGDPPGCRTYPNVTKTDTMHWYCDPGYDFRNFSVYFSCALICDITDKVVRSYYCGEQLHWELDDVVSSPHSCQAPQKAPEENNVKLILLITVGFVVIAVCIALAFAWVCWKRKKRRNMRRREDGELEDRELAIPLNELNPVQRGNPVAVNVNEEIKLLPKKNNNPPSLDDSGPDSSNSSGVGGSSMSSAHSGGGSNSCSVQTEVPLRPTVKPSIKIMTSKNDSSQMSVPIQGDHYSIEIGSDLFVIPDCPDGIAVREFSLHCKDMRKSFRGEKCMGNIFMYVLTNVNVEDSDFYKWTMRLENGTQHDGIFQLYVSIPENSASVYRTGPYGEENLASGNNQQVHAEVHAQSYIPFSRDMYSDNQSRHREDSGMSSGRLNSQASNNSSANRVRGEQAFYSSSGYGTGPSEDRNPIIFNDRYRPLDPSSISNVASSYMLGDLPLSHLEDLPDDSISECGDAPIFNSSERPIPPGCPSEVRHYETRDLGSDHEEDQTHRKHHWSNGSNEDDTSVKTSYVLHGEMESVLSDRPVLNSAHRSPLPEDNPQEQFHRQVEEALKKFHAEGGTGPNSKEAVKSNPKPYPNHTDNSENSDSNSHKCTDLKSSENRDLNPPEKDDLKPSKEGVLKHSENSASQTAENDELNPAGFDRLNQAESANTNSAPSIDLIPVENGGVSHPERQFQDLNFSTDLYELPDSEHNSKS